MAIRAVSTDELPLLQDIERAAGRCFRDIGMPEIADDDPLPLGELARYRRAGRAWVSADEADAPVAYLIADRVEGNLHVEQVSVHSGPAPRRPRAHFRLAGDPRTRGGARPGPLAPRLHAQGRVTAGTRAPTGTGAPSAPANPPPSV